MENIRIEKQHTEDTIKKKENEDKNRIKTQAELSKFKVPKINKNLITEIQIERSKKKKETSNSSIYKDNGKNNTSSKTNKGKTKGV